MSDYEFTLSLRIRHPRIDPSMITDELGIKPQHTWKAGDRRLDAREEFSLPLSADSLALLGRLRLTVTFDIHPHSPRAS
jgi:hypothetical protein